MDRRALPGLAAGLAGLFSGVLAAVLRSPLLAVLAGASALGAAGAALALLQRLRAAEGSPPVAPSDISPEELLAQEPPSVVDDETGLPDARFFDLAVEGRVAAARRHLWPVTVVLLDVALLADDDARARRETLAAFAALMRQTLREADIACRLSGSSFGLILEDTTEEGGVWTAERLQIALAKDLARVRRLAAGVATYPTHGLRADELLVRAQGALTRAVATETGHGLGQVEVARLDAL